ncbi:hypothetical protein [Variovorax sp. efr-133-TYG-130]|uniref:hypothetical protein n=1 Tax=Variovorax sp. efr-133-TYG-130 TaxID=3040327 RepID=UPI00255701C6|nr:hypothetical protein [Variovorax sp. efr-133-TYG-130]
MKVSEQNLLPLRTFLGVSVLAGAASGREAAGKLQVAVSALSPPWVFDFKGMELITASAFREAILSIVRWAAEDGQPCFLANVDEITRDEGLIAAAQSSNVLLFCALEGSTITDVNARGLLDPKLETTLALVLQLGEADAKAVSDASGEGTVTTAWNNRLVALNRMGLLAERKVGKTKYYSPVVKGMSYGQ